MTTARNSFCRGFAFVLLYVLLTMTSSQAAVESVWTYAPPEPNVDASIDVSPAIADINGDGHKEIVIGTTYGHVVALDHTGKELWKTEAGDVFFIPPTVADITGDGHPEILVGGRREKFVCLDGTTGKIIWEWRHSGRLEWGTTAIAIADFDGDKVNEAVTGDSNGVVVCLKGDGHELWRYTGKQGWTLCPAVGDINNDGNLEIVVGGTEMPLVCLSNKGTELWKLEKGGKGASPVLADLNGDGKLEIITGMGKSLAAVDRTGTIMWTCPMAGLLDAAISVGDADQDGAPEIYAADLAGQLVKVTAEGKLVWIRDTGGRVRRCPSIGDVDGDGVIEILVAGYSNAIYVFRPDGQLKALVPLGESSNGTATISDLEGKGQLSIICPASYLGLKAFRWEGAPKGGKVLWPEYRFNGLRTAAFQSSSQTPETVRISAVDYGAFHAGLNKFSIQIENPGKRALRIRLSTVFGSEEPCSSLLQSDKPVITHSMPYSISGHETLNVSLECTVVSDDDKHTLLAQSSRREHVVPFQRELMDVEYALDELGPAVKNLPDPAFIRDRIDAFRFRLPEYRERAAKSTVMKDEELTSLRNDVAALWLDSTELARDISAIQKATGGNVPRVLLSAANPWAPFGGMAEVVEGRTRPVETHIEAFKGEHENGAVNVFNFEHAPITFRVEMSELKCDVDGGKTPVPGRSVVTLREVLDVPTQKNDMSADAIPLLNQGEVFTVPGWTGRQLWLEFDTTALTPGNWTGMVRVKSLAVTPLELTIPISVTVWKTALPEKQAATLCHWGFVHQSCLKDQPEAALDDQIAHGTNVFVSSFFPKATYDAQGQLVGAIDFTEHDAYIKKHAPHGIILFNYYQSTLQGPGEHTGEAYQKAHVTWLKAWVAHLAELGVGYDGFALYPVDEPGLQSGLVDQFLRYAKLARAADPRIKIYTDPVNRITMEELKNMAPYVDIWCPNSGSFLKIENADKLAFIKSLNKTIWTYECSPNAKHQSPLGYYRCQAWLAWHHGITGIGYWSYCTSTDDPWFRPAAIHEYLFVYPGCGVVPSKRWKAIRDGLEDYSMLTLLRDIVESAKKEGRAPEAVAAAETLLKEESSAISQFCGIDKDDTLPGKEGIAQVRIVEDRRFQSIQSIREKMAQLLEKLAPK